jgi:imidazolonepropionase-like amidohydrolase
MRTLFINTTIWPATGEPAFAGELLVDGNKIAAIAHGPATLPRDGAAIIDGAGCTLIPGLIDGHGHLSFPDSAVFADIGDIPPEEHTLVTMHNARKVLDQGFTGMIGAGAAKPRLDIVIRNEIEAGRIPGPRLLAATPEITVTGGLGDERLMHLYRESVALIADGPDAIRQICRTLVREGVDIIKLNVSGNHTLRNAPADATVMTEAEVAAACEVARATGRRVAAHARSARAVQFCLRQGVDILYHCEFADAETIDLLEAARDRIFLAPAVGLLYNSIYEGAAWGLTPEKAERNGLMRQFELVCDLYAALRQRGLRVLIGGDYGFAWNPHGTNARDLAHFGRLFGYTPEAALTAATRTGAEAMLLGDRLGQIQEGYLADLLLVVGRPHEDVTILQHADRLRAIMKDGKFHKVPAPADHTAARPTVPAE